jgi:hypothetical protein
MRSLNKKAALITGCFVLALVFLAPSVTQGDEWNLATKFKINRQTEVPGMVLQADTTYVIRRFDSPSTRNVVQIFNEDQTKMLTMFMAISAERLEPTDETLFTFIETAPQYPLPIKEWFYPGRLHGLEFVYSKAQREQIAGHMVNAVTQTASITKTEETTAALEKPSVEEVAPAEPQIDQEPVAEQVEVDRPVEIAQNTEPEVQQEDLPKATAVTEEDRELPRTAGELPMIALIGALCLGAGLGFRVLSSKS